jgi:hypothetical protein
MASAPAWVDCGFLDKAAGPSPTSYRMAVAIGEALKGTTGVHMCFGWRMRYQIDFSKYTSKHWPIEALKRPGGIKGKTHKFHLSRGSIVLPDQCAGRDSAIGGAEAGEDGFGVVDVTMERNSVRRVRPRPNANGTLDSHRVYSLVSVVRRLVVLTRAQGCGGGECTAEGAWRAAWPVSERA